MLTKDNFTLEHIQEIHGNTNVDPLLLERSIYAFGLLEALVRVGMPFIFKVGQASCCFSKSREGYRRILISS